MMDYLWRRYSPQTRYEIDPSMKISSPPLEISRRRGEVVVVNPLPRFAGPFRVLLQRRDLWERQEDDLQALCNCLLHFLAHLDRTSGLSRGLLAEDELDEELSLGCFGAESREIYERLKPEQKREIVRLLRKQESEQGRRLYFREAVKALFPQAALYFYHGDDIFLIYLPQAENGEDAGCMRLLVMLFLDATAKWQVYWEHPFGIIGRKRTMRLNNMRLYDAGKDS